MNQDPQVSYKAGANYSDVRLIRKYAALGNDAACISDELRIKTHIVENWMPEKPKRKKKAETEVTTED